MLPVRLTVIQMTTQISSPALSLLTIKSDPTREKKLSRADMHEGQTTPQLPNLDEEEQMEMELDSPRVLP